MDKMQFILTSNETTFKLLKGQGFTCLGQDENGVWRFLNNQTMKFDVNPKNITYTNIINI